MLIARSCFLPLLSVPSIDPNHSQSRIGILGDCLGVTAGRDFFLLPQAGELSVKLDPYIRTKRRDWGEASAETQIWPLIKLVEVTLPKSELIPEGVVLVDIPGTGDFNSKRDEMWKKVILFHMALFSLPLMP